MLEGLIQKDIKKSKGVKRGKKEINHGIFKISGVV